jgi:hypothetical protein
MLATVGDEVDTGRVATVISYPGIPHSPCVELPQICPGVLAIDVQTRKNANDRVEIHYQED